MVYACLGYTADCTAAVARSGTALSTVAAVLERLRELLDTAASLQVLPHQCSASGSQMSQAESLVMSRAEL
jgi:hypothetical protein